MNAVLTGFCLLIAWLPAIPAQASWRALDRAEPVEIYLPVVLADPVARGGLLSVRPDAWLTSEDLRVTRNIRDGLQRAVMDSDPTAIRIVTRHGAVTLSGTIRTSAERTQVDAVVYGTPGVQTLTDELQVR